MTTRKARIAQEMRNAYPEWARVRSDDQSVGASLLNSLALSMEPLLTELYRGQKNQFLTTASVDEIDLTYKFVLPNNFTFETISDNAIAPVPISPTVSGLVGSTWYPVTEVITGSVKDFWYEALPNRLSIDETFDIDGLLVASGMSSDLYLTMVNSGLFLDNRLTVIADGDQLITVDTDNNIMKSKVRLTGTSWKITDEAEDVIFLFSESKQSFKVWHEVDTAECVDFPTDTFVQIYSHQFNQDRYLDSFDTLSQFNEQRENLPYFWTLGTSASGYSSLTLEKYTALNAIDLLRIKPSFAEYRSWELLDEDGIEISALDISPQPFQQRILAIDESDLFIYDTFEELPNIKLMRDATQEALVNLEFTSDYITRGEEIEIAALFIRPIKTIIKHRISIKYPDGEELGILEDGTMVPISSDYWVVSDRTDRFIRQPIFVELNDFGQHIVTLECLYLDQVTEKAQRSILVGSKRPLVQIPHTVDNPVGIDIDHLGRILILDSDNTVHQIKLHFDNCLIDYNNKEILFRENYDEVKVIK